MRGWLYCDIIFSLLTIFGEGVIKSWHYIFTPDNICCRGDYIVTLYFHPWQYLVRGVIISWDYIVASGNIWSGDDYIVTYFHSWQYLVRGWIYRDIIFSLLIIFGEGVIISWHYIFTPGNIWLGDYHIVTLYFHSWQYLVRGWLYSDIFFTPEDIWWGGDYIMTYFHSWRYLVRGWLYCDITISFLTLP